MKYLMSGLVFAVALTNIGCPSNNNPGQPANVVGTPTTQCLSTIPQGYGGNMGYSPYVNFNCQNAYGYGNNAYISPYGTNNWYYGFNNGFRCPYGTLPIYGNNYGLGCVSAGALGGYNLMAYAYMNNAWSYAGYYGYNAFYNYPYYAAVACTASYVTSYGVCNCVPVGGYSGYGICTR